MSISLQLLPIMPMSSKTVWPELDPNAAHLVAEPLCSRLINPSPIRIRTSHPQFLTPHDHREHSGVTYTCNDSHSDECIPLSHSIDPWCNSIVDRKTQRISDENDCCDMLASQISV